MVTTRQRSSRASNSASGVRAKRGRRAENDVGIDPHKRMLTVSVVEPTGAVLATASFRISGDGHRAMEAFVLGFGPTRLWAIFDWIEAWYNPRRRHSYCDMLSPIDYETASAA